MLLLIPLYSTNWIVLHFSKNRKIKTVQLVCYADFRFMITLSSYSVKSNYFCMILNLLRLLRCQIIVFFVCTIQLLSIVPEKRGRKGQAKHHCTGITLRIEETSTLRVKKVLFFRKRENWKKDNFSSNALPTQRVGRSVTRSTVHWAL